MITELKNSTKHPSDAKKHEEFSETHTFGLLQSLELLDYSALENFLSTVSTAGDETTAAANTLKNTISSKNGQTITLTTGTDEDDNPINTTFGPFSPTSDLTAFENSLNTAKDTFSTSISNGANNLTSYTTFKNSINTASVTLSDSLTVQADTLANVNENVNEDAKVFFIALFQPYIVGFNDFIQDQTTTINAAFQNIIQTSINVVSSNQLELASHLYHARDIQYIEAEKKSKYRLHKNILDYIESIEH